jgi:predicted transcriptional regulator
MVSMTAARRGTGQLEAEVLAILWDQGAWMTPGEVRGILGGEPPLTYSTVMTILRRLWKKGVVERERDGKAFAYHAVRTREEQAASRMAELLASAHDPVAALSHFVDELATDQRAQLRRVLRHKEGS